MQKSRPACYKIIARDRTGNQPDPKMSGYDVAS